MTSVAAPTRSSPPSEAVSAPTDHRASLVWGTLFAILSIFGIVVGIETAYHFLGPAIDGPFQLYNALRRIMAGQRGGVDFQFFHGLGIPYLHYVPFRLFGGDFQASELSRQLLSALGYPAVLLLFFRIVVRDWKRSLQLATVVVALSIVFNLATLFLARNSLLGIRSALPTLIPALWCLRIGERRRSLLIGAALGVSLLLGTEQGLAALVAV